MKNRAQTKTSREKFLDFQQRNSRLEKIHAFQKKNASNELNIFFLKKKRRGFFTVNL